MQLSLFGPEKPKPEIPYWEKHFGWKPKIGKLARIDATVAFCQTQLRTRYCYCMRVEVIQIENETAIVESTKEWEDATSGSDKAGLIFKVKIDELAPIL
ncbi:MAG TPA: hypothetical protein VFM82_12125 [Flavobacteriaceae bacterium]|nr:hypothetical protein [Flavobacteriaceae bacterium]